jgi:ADP-dependent NAD(P)H-hydrate dehydratase / NAD(P)H-hydrate epimerase
MVPVVTPEEMAAIDAAAPEPVEVLIGRAGAAVAREAVDLLGGTYGRRVTVVAGKGNNGNDGRDAARRLERRGVRVRVIPAAEAPDRLPPSDLVVDAAYGTGFRGSYHAPDPAGAPVLAVDIPSGVGGLTGEASGSPAPADRTVTFAALKPGLLLHPGRALAGEVVVADIGLDTSSARAHVVDAGDVAAWIPRRAVDAHKWKAAVVIAGGSPGMTGAAHLAAAAAFRAGAGMVRVASPGVEHDPGLPTEAIAVPVPVAGWEGAVLDQLGRARALIVGPGLGLSAPNEAAVGHVVADADVPTVVDGDGLSALGERAAELLGGRRKPASVVLTPHDGEFARLAGGRPGADRCAAARDLAARTGAVVLLKGPTTVVAEPGGRVLLSTVGDQRLATAGTGDVLSGIIGALLARGVPGFEAAAAGAWLHGTAAMQGPPEGLVASDLVDAIPLVFTQSVLAPEVGVMTPTSGAGSQGGEA